ncbi:hypothetical protein WMW72_17095 [Paenibacillus filicis]|uniref:Uncharacterized protein n=1 Tax=Paenibacillus filicis TaxID=669464 RepID=A0ABU9DLB0_9BACL
MEGDILGRSIYTAEGRLILNKGVKLDDKRIDTIKRRGQRYVVIESRVGETSGTEGIKADLRRLTELLLQELNEKAQLEEGLSFEPINDWADHAAASFMEQPDVIYYYQDLRPSGPDLIGHSLNVCLLSMLTGRALGYTLP